MVWHTDGSWRRTTGQATMLFAEQIPSTGGDTGFADMYSAYDALDARGAALGSASCARSTAWISRATAATARTR